MNKTKWKNFSREQLQEFIYESQTKKEFMMKLGYADKASNAFKQILEAYPDLDISNFNHRDYRIEDLSKKTFGNLTVVSLDRELMDKRKEQGLSKSTFWKCKCKCGKIISVRASDLKSGNTSSCGCNKRKDLSGKIFGDLKVIQYDEQKSKSLKHTYYKVQCVCGKIFSTRGENLLQLRTTSCGCQNRSYSERIIENILKESKIPFKTEYSFSDLLGNNTNPLRFDFVIFNKEKITIIECQGEQHYNPVDHFGGEKQFLRQQSYDNKKREYCKQHNLKLIEIPYWDFDKINSEYLLNLIK